MRRVDLADLEIFVRDCPDCHKPIMWAKTVASKTLDWMPIDADPAPNGNVLAYPDPPRRLVCVVIGEKLRRDAMAADGWLFFQHHRLSCPRADRWARQRVSQRPHPTGVSTPQPNTAPHDERTLW